VISAPKDHQGVCIGCPKVVEGTTIWTDFFCIWKDCNEAIHGHDLKSQNQARHRRVCAEKELLHLKRDQVLAVDTDVFIGDTPQALETFSNVSSATHIQNWIYVWKPVIASSVQSAKNMAIQGVRILTDYFPVEPSTNTGPPHNKAPP
jgi:hypothetical protein